MSASSLPLHISPQQVSTIFQNLVDLKNECESDTLSEQIPIEIIEILNKFHNAQKSFIKKIDKYMHKPKYKANASEEKTIRTIIETCPEFLSSEDKDGEYPIHCATKEKSTASIYVPMYVEIGSKNGIGAGGGISCGKALGGLMTFRNGSSAFVRIVQDGDLKTLKAIAELDSKIIDLKPLLANTGAIHLAVHSNKSAEMTKWLSEQCPDGLYNSKLSKKNFPIHGSKSFYIFKHLLQKAIEYKPNHETVGGLFHHDIYNSSAIDCAIKTLGNKTKVFGCISQVLSRYSHINIPILHNAIQLAPKHTEDIILYCPHSCFILDQRGRLPIHVALASGMKWSIPLVSIINANMQHLSEMDPVTKLCPSALAALEPACDLDTIYHLLRMHPKHVEVGISKVRKSVSVLSSSSLSDIHMEKVSRKRTKNCPS